MKSRESKTSFWITLAVINVVSLIYPLKLIHGEKSVEKTFFAAFALIVMVLLLVVVDAVGIVLMDGQTRERAASRRSSRADHKSSLWRGFER